MPKFNSKPSRTPAEIADVIRARIASDDWDIYETNRLELLSAAGWFVYRWCGNFYLCLDEDNQPVFLHWPIAFEEWWDTGVVEEIADAVCEITSRAIVASEPGEHWMDMVLFWLDRNPGTSGFTRGRLQDVLVGDTSRWNSPYAED